MNRLQFVKTPDPDADKLLSSTLTKLNKINKSFRQAITYPLHLELPDRFILPINCFAKIQLAIESCILLIRNGYYGTSNALYRQIYEYILWARIALVLDDNESKQISSIIFSDRIPPSQLLSKGLKPEHIDVIKYLGKHITWSVPTEFARNLSYRELRSLLIDYYDDLCVMTHASNEAQQHFFPNSEFYSNSMASIRSLTELMYAAYDVYYIFYNILVHANPELDHALSSKLDPELAGPDKFFQTLSDVQDSYKCHILNDTFHTIDDILDKTDKLLEQVAPQKNGGTPFLNIALRGKWKYK